VSSTSKDQSLLAKNRRAFLLRKLHSLTGIAPVGGFMVFHLWTNARALGGQESFDAAVREIHHMPYLHLLEAGILLPLLFHAGYGVVLALEARHNVIKYSTSRNWAFTLQRITGFLAFLFIAFHMYGLWWPKVTGKLAAENFYPRLCEQMSATYGGMPLIAFAYILGIAACVYHFANGLWGFCFSWGITVSKRAQRTAAWVFGLVGVAVLCLGVNTVIHFATGKGILEDQLMGGDDHSSGRTCNDIRAEALKARTEQPTNP
jgi:succinate dehydrogenase / fumarate reductase, cytochrome b subunit